MIIYENSRIVAIATSDSRNPKTGKGKQVFILDRTMHPSDSRKSGNDAKVQCKGCPLASYSGCYVIDMPLIAIYKKYMAGGYQALKLNSPEWNKFFSVPYVRLGAYGNPSCLPIGIVASISKLATRVTGYFHDWHLMTPDRARSYGRFLMASTHPATYRAAKAIGLRTFTTGKLASVGSYGIECLADSKGITCAECGLCDGTKRNNASRPDVWIDPHGFQTKKALLN